MTKSERARKERMWLKVHKFATTKSLQERFASSGFAMKEQEWCCYIQNKVLMCLRGFDEARIHSKYFKDKIGPTYKQYVRKLLAWDELEIDDRYIIPSAFSHGKTKRYSIPQSAMDSGTVNRDFKTGKIKSTKDDSNYKQQESWIRDTIVASPNPLHFFGAGFSVFKVMNGHYALTTLTDFILSVVLRIS